MLHDLPVHPLSQSHVPSLHIPWTHAGAHIGGVGVGDGTGTGAGVGIGVGGVGVGVTPGVGVGVVIGTGTGIGTGIGTGTVTGTGATSHVSYELPKGKLTRSFRTWSKVDNRISR